MKLWRKEEEESPVQVLASVCHKSRALKVGRSVQDRDGANRSQLSSPRSINLLSTRSQPGKLNPNEHPTPR